MTRDQLAQRDVFLGEIRDDPDDDVPRLILGDWLADQGDPRGEFIQLDVRVATMPDGPERRSLESRRRQLLAAHAAGWLGPLLDVVSEWRWERGMLHITARPERLFDEALAAVASPEFVWVEGVRLRIDRMLRNAWWRAVLGRVPVLDLSGGPAGVGLVYRILRYKGHLAGLRSLNLADNRIGPEEVARLAGCPHLHRLTRLDLSRTGINGEGAEALIASPYLTRLRCLALGGVHLSYATVERLNERFGAGVVRLSRPPGP